MSLKICVKVRLVSNWVNVGINQVNGPYSNVAQLSFQNEWNMRGPDQQVYRAGIASLQVICHIVIVIQTISKANMQ